MRTFSPVKLPTISGKGHPIRTPNGSHPQRSTTRRTLTLLYSFQRTSLAITSCTAFPSKVASLPSASPCIVVETVVQYVAVIIVAHRCARDRRQSVCTIRIGCRESGAMRPGAPAIRLRRTRPALLLAVTTHKAAIAKENKENISFGPNSLTVGSYSSAKAMPVETAPVRPRTTSPRTYPHAMHSAIHRDTTVTLSSGNGHAKLACCSEIGVFKKRGEWEHLCGSFDRQIRKPIRCRHGHRLART